jgi:hypothetical protein
MGIGRDYFRTTCDLEQDQRPNNRKAAEWKGESGPLLTREAPYGAFRIS